MIGTLGDKPLLKIVIDSLVYFVDLDTRIVLQDKPGLPELTDMGLIERVLEAADSSK
jgi:hypothetical protein